MHPHYYCSVLLYVFLHLICIAAKGQTTVDQQADELYDRIMEADGFNEVVGYEILGDIYPEYNILQQADQAYEQAMASEDPQEITKIGSQLAQLQHQPVRQMQKLIQKLRRFPASDTINRMLAALLLDYHALAPQEVEIDGFFFELLGAPDSVTLADPVDWIDPVLALEALLSRYRSPVEEQADPRILEQRLAGLEHCLELLHYLRRVRSDEKDRLALAATVPPLAHRALLIALQLDKQLPNTGWRARAFQIAEAAKATLLADRLQGFAADRQQLNWPSLGKQLRLARHLATQSGDFFERPQQLDELLASHLPGMESWPSEGRNDISIASIQKQLAAEQALMVSYFLLGEQAIVFHLNGDEIRVDHFYWNKETQQALQQIRAEMTTQHFMQEPTAAFEQFTAASFWLYENVLLRPVLRHQQQAVSHLILLPDADLWDLPFGALISQEAPSGPPSYSPGNLAYLINTYDLALAPSAQSWLSLQSKSKLPLKVAALAPEFSGNAVALREACASPLPALPHSSIEAKNIMEIVDGRLFLGPDAQFRSLQTDATAFSVWHLATHACRHEDNPGQSAIFLQDGALTAEEIASLPLNLQLVVLSACETQSGPYSAGEGVLSIGRAFLQGGSHALIGSLWPVSDAATSELMPLFYESLQQGLRTSSALRQAQLSFLETQDRLTAHPHYWAGFVLVGQDSSFEQDGKGNYLIWLALSIFAVFIIFALKKKT